MEMKYDSSQHNHQRIASHLTFIHSFKKLIMKPAFLIIAVSLLLTNGTFAQVAQKDTNNKLGEYDEIIIKRKTDDKDAKVIVEIVNDEVFINNKPLQEYVDDIVSVQLKTSKHFSIDGNGVTAFRRGNFEGIRMDKPFLGVSTQGSTEGAKVTTVLSNSAAEKAGLKINDVIVKINDEPVFDHEQLTAVINKLKPDDKVTILYKSGKKENKATVTLGKRPASARVKELPGAPFPPSSQYGPPMGFDFNEVEGLGGFFKARADKPRLGIKAQDTDDGKGVKVLEVDPGSVAASSGIQTDDLITSFDGKEVNSATELVRASREARDKYTFDIQLKRGGKTKTVTVKIPKKLNTAEL